MKLSYFLTAAIAVLSLASCQGDADAPSTAAVVPAPDAVPAQTPMTAPAPAEPAADAHVVEQARMDFAYRCRQSDGAWNEAAQACDVTPALCPTFGTWVNDAGCKSEVTKAECVAEGQQFVEGHGCLIRSIPTAAMREADFNKG